MSMTAQKRVSKRSFPWFFFLSPKLGKGPKLLLYPCPSPCASWSLLPASLPGFPEFAWPLSLCGLPRAWVPAHSRDWLSCSLQCVERDVSVWSRGRDHTAHSHYFYRKIYVEKATLGGGDQICSEVFCYLEMFGSCYHAQHPIDNNSPSFQLRE